MEECSAYRPEDYSEISPVRNTNGFYASQDKWNCCQCECTSSVWKNYCVRTCLLLYMQVKYKAVTWRQQLSAICQPLHLSLVLLFPSIPHFLTFLSLLSLYIVTQTSAEWRLQFVIRQLQKKWTGQHPDETALSYHFKSSFICGIQRISFVCVQAAVQEV